MGRRLAFDQAKGRLWVVCGRCGRWNLTPMEERWEAIEGCEKLFRDTVLRASSDNIGLARLSSGLELIRIGRPQFPEYASWRYADKFRRRRNVALLTGVLGTVAYIALANGLAAVTAGAGAAFTTVVGTLMEERRRRRHLGEATLPDGKRLELLGAHVEGMTIKASAEGAWHLELPKVKHRHLVTYIEEAGRKRILGFPTADLREGYSLSVEESRRILGRTAAVYNTKGGSSTDVRYALEVFDETKGEAEARLASHTLKQRDQRVLLRDVPVPVRLALEMQLSETNERRWLDGELYLLESAWEEAEKLAAIADELTLPEWVREKLTALRGAAPR